MTSLRDAPGHWQWRLNDHCRNRGLAPPLYNEVSDRRGGRTAWSSIVTIAGHTFPARFWYDGAYVENAREDAAEVALQRLGVCPSPPGPQQRLLHNALA